MRQPGTSAEWPKTAVREPDLCVLVDCTNLQLLLLRVSGLYPAAHKADCCLCRDCVVIVWTLSNFYLFREFDQVVRLNCEV